MNCPSLPKKYFNLFLIRQAGGTGAEMLSTLFLDNDGVLVDTEKYYYEANRLICANYGHMLDRNEYGELFLKTNRGVGDIFKRSKSVV